MSDSAIESFKESNGIVLALKSLASSSALSNVLLEIDRCPTPTVFKALATKLPASPAPTRSAFLSINEPSFLWTIWTAAKLIDKGFRPTAVSSRVFLPTRTAAWNKPTIGTRTVSTSEAILRALLTWPNISDSPTIWESNPLATLNRCETASSPTFE